MLFVNVLIMLFIAVLVLFALRKRIKASKDNQPVYDDNGILIGYVDNRGSASVYGSGIYNPDYPGIDPD